MMRGFILFLVFCASAFSETPARQEALQLAHAASQSLGEEPEKAAQLAAQAFRLLEQTDTPAAADLAACAGLAARAWRRHENSTEAIVWFQKAIKLQPSPALRAELSDTFMRLGQLTEAREALGKKPVPPHAQWHQSSAKLHLTCGQPALAQEDIAQAILALPEDDFANLATLHIDAAGISLRLKKSPQDDLEKAKQFLRRLPSIEPEMLSALAAVTAQAPDLLPEEALTILQGLPLGKLPPAARSSYAVTLAEAAAKANRPELVRQVLTDIDIPPDHPLLARALALQGDPESSQVALRWLDRSDVTDPDLLLGLQRTVDPISPVISEPVSELSKIALQAKNFALRKKLSGTASSPKVQTVSYLIYEHDFTTHYGALLWTPEPRWVELGPADKIHRRIAETIDTAERTLAVASLGATLDVRLTQLWKSLWLPLTPWLDSEKPLNIVPVGLLHSVPWATLRHRNGRYLCQEYQKVKILSLMGNFPSSPPSQNPPLISGTQRAPQDFPQLPELPGVPLELSAITAHPLLNPTKEEILRELKRSPKLIHLAGHGFVQDEHHFRAGLALTKGSLEAREIVALDLSQTDLVIISACRGGIGRPEIGGNWSSLRRAFIAAGARHVMAAQWRVRDDDLPEFMGRFHQKLADFSASQALWDLQREWLEDPKHGPENFRAASAGAWVIEERPSGN